MRGTGFFRERAMTNKLFTNCDTNSNQTAAELINRNVSFDFQAFLGKVGPAPSRFALKGEADRHRSEVEAAQNGSQGRSENNRG
jgi:hypothetical protein